jgi:hypothetical protein
MLLLTVACSQPTSVGSDGPTLFKGVYTEFKTQQWRPDADLATTLAIQIFTAARQCTPDEVHDSLSGYGILTAWVTESGQGPIPAGSYPIGGSAGSPPWLGAGGAYTWYALGGAEGGSQAATSGTLELSRVEASAVEGRVDFTLGDGTQIEGKFESTCPR